MKKMVMFYFMFQVLIIMEFFQKEIEMNKQLEAVLKQRRSKKIQQILFYGNHLPHPYLVGIHLGDLEDQDGIQSAPLCQKNHQVFLLISIAVVLTWCFRIMKMKQHKLVLYLKIKILKILQLIGFIMDLLMLREKKCQSQLAILDSFMISIKNTRERFCD